MQYITKDSWVRKERESWFRRDTDEGKPRYDLIPFDCLRRLAELYARWAVKYWDNNRRLAEEQDAIDRFKQSAFRHFMQRMNWENDEDHAMAIVFNVFAYEHLTNRYKATDTWEVEKQSEIMYENSYHLYNEYWNYIWCFNQLHNSSYSIIASWWYASAIGYDIKYFWNSLSDWTPIYTNLYKDWTTINFVPMCLIKEEWNKDLWWSTCIMEWSYDYDVQRVIDNLVS